MQLYANNFEYIDQQYVMQKHKMMYFPPYIWQVQLFQKRIMRERKLCFLILVLRIISYFTGYNTYIMLQFHFNDLDDITRRDN